MNKPGIEEMEMLRVIKNERGSAWAWIFTIFLLIVVGAAAYLSLIRFGMLEAPEALANLPGMEMVLPPVVEEETEGTLEVTVEDSLRSQNVLLAGERDSALSRVSALEQQLADSERFVQEREDEIALLQSALNLARDQNINNVALIYESMDPEEASVILSNMGAERASLILGAMRESKAADVLALMDEALATEITNLLAGFEGEAAELSRLETPPSEETGSRRPVTGSPTVPTPSVGSE